RRDGAGGALSRSHGGRPAGGSGMAAGAARTARGRDAPDGDRVARAARGVGSEKAVPQGMNLVVTAALVLTQGLSNHSGPARAKDLADTYLAAYFERHPDEATLDGVADGPHDRLPDNSPDAIGRWQAREDAWLAQLRRINPRRIEGRPEAVAYGIMRDAIEGSVATRVCRFELWSVAQTGGGWLPTITALATLQGVGTEEARRQTLARWRAVPAYIATEMANHRDGLRRGYPAPRHHA